MKASTVADDASGHHASFEALYLAQVARVVRFAMLLGASEPEDVAQESFAKLYRARSRRPLDDEVRYLNRIVVNQVRTTQRDRARAARRTFHLVHAPSADESVTMHESIEALMRTLDEISRRQREAIVLRYWLDLPLAEIADVMGVRTGTVKSLISRGLDRLAHALEDYR